MEPEDDELDLPNALTDIELTFYWLRDVLSSMMEQLTWLMQIVEYHIEELDEKESQDE